MTTPSDAPRDDRTDATPTDAVGDRAEAAVPATTPAEPSAADLDVPEAGERATTDGSGLDVVEDEDEEVERASADDDAAPLDERAPAEPADDTVSRTAADEPAAGALPAGDAPVQGLAADAVPADEVPADEVPADEVPADEVPAEEGPADEHARDDEPTDEAAVAPAVAAPGADAAEERAQEGERTAAADAPVAAPATGPRTAWSALGAAMRPRATRAQILAGVLCAVLGFALVVQVRQTSDESLSGMRQSDLVRILDETTTRGDALAREAADLQRERDELLSGSDTRQAALDAARRSAATQGILSGRLPAEGPGVVVTLTEPDGPIKPVTMLAVLEELRNAGAEAVQLNDQRVTASSAFTGTPGAVQLDGVTLQAPYVWIAIGDPDTIATALQIAGGAMAQVRSNGGSGAVDRQDFVEVSAVRIVPDPVFATPVPPTSD